MKARISGVYVIENRITDQCYVGSSNCIRTRWTRHRFLLRSNHHENNYLQNSWNKYGEPNFGFVILELAPESLIRIRERHWMNQLDSLIRRNGFNLSESTYGGTRRKFERCQVAECERPHLSFGYCNAHYLRMKRRGTCLITTLPPLPDRGCVVPLCKNQHDSHGYCGVHAYYIRKYGEIRNSTTVVVPRRECYVEACIGRRVSNGLCHKHAAYLDYRRKKNLPIKPSVLAAVEAFKNDKLTVNHDGMMAT